MYALYSKKIGEINSLPTDYVQGCINTANSLRIPPAHLHALVLIEGGIGYLLKINSSGYGGLGQWGPAAAKELGYSSVQALINANPTYTQQWALMDRWIRFILKTYANGVYYGPGFLYICHFLPYNAKFYGQKDKTLYNSDKNRQEYLVAGTVSYNRNNGLDFDKDGKITIGDIDKVVASKMAGIKTDYAQAPTNTGNSITDYWNKAMNSITDYLTPQSVKDAANAYNSAKGAFDTITNFVEQKSPQIIFIIVALGGIKLFDYVIGTPKRKR